MTCHTVVVWMWRQKTDVRGLRIAMLRVIRPTTFMIQMPTAKPAHELTVLKHLVAETATVKVGVHLGWLITVIAEHASVGIVNVEESRINKRRVRDTVENLRHFSVLRPRVFYLILFSLCFHLLN